MKKKLRLLVEVGWDGSQNSYVVKATGIKVSPKLVGGLQGAEGASEPLEEICKAAERFTDLTPNAYALYETFHDYMGNWYEYAPFVNKYEFQLFRIPQAALKDERVHLLQAKSLHYDCQMTTKKS